MLSISVPAADASIGVYGLKEASEPMLCRSKHCFTSSLKPIRLEERIGYHWIQPSAVEQDLDDFNND